MATVVTRTRLSVTLYYIAHLVYILILSPHAGLWQDPPSGLFFSGYSGKYSVGIAHHPVACYMTHFLLLSYLTEPIAPVFSWQYKSCSCLLRRFLQAPVVSPVSVPNVLPVLTQKQVWCRNITCGLTDRVTRSWVPKYHRLQDVNSVGNYCAFQGQRGNFWKAKLLRYTVYSRI